MSLQWFKLSIDPIQEGFSWLKAWLTIVILLWSWFSEISYHNQPNSGARHHDADQDIHWLRGWLDTHSAAN